MLATERANERLEFQYLTETATETEAASQPVCALDFKGILILNQRMGFI